MGNPLQTIPNLPPAITISGAEQTWINQAGVDRRIPLSFIALLLGQGIGATFSIIVGGPLTLAYGGFYGVETDLAAVTLTLPPLTHAGLIFVADVGYNASANPITINAAGADLTALFGATSGSFSINTNDGVVALMGVPGRYWRALPFQMF